MASYKDLEIYQKAFCLAVSVHKASMTLPKHELYELGSQVRRSSQSIRANIVEGYGRRAYKNDFVHFLVVAEASLLETISHLEMLKELYEIEVDELLKEYDHLGKQMTKYLNYVRNNWRTPNT